MKQIQNQEYQKKPASKDKSKESSRRTRFQVINATREENSELFDRTSARFKIKKQRKQSSPYLSDRKLIKFLAKFCIPQEKKETATNDIYIYNNLTPTEQLAYGRLNAKAFEGESQALRRVFSPKYPKGYIETPSNYHKGEGRRDISAYILAENDWPEPRPLGAGGSQALDNVMSEAEWLEFVEMFGKRDAKSLLESGLVTIDETTKRSPMKYDDEAQPKFNQPDKHRSNVSAYRKWEPEQRKAEEVEDAFARMSPFINSPDWDKFVSLMGKEEALKWFEAGLKQATREK